MLEPGSARARKRRRDEFAESDARRIACAGGQALLAGDAARERNQQRTETIRCASICNSGLQGTLLCWLQALGRGVDMC